MVNCDEYQFPQYNVMEVDNLGKDPTNQQFTNADVRFKLDDHVVHQEQCSYDCAQDTFVVLPSGELGSLKICDPAHFQQIANLVYNKICKKH